MTIWFTSDNHYFHDAIRFHCSRNFSSVEEMNEEMIRRHNEIVAPNDIVYNLGDFSLKVNRIPDILPRLNGKIHLITGNHCEAHSCHKKYVRAVRKYLEYGFSSVQERMELKIGSHTVELCHLPFLKPEDADQRYSQWRPIDKGQFLLHGHCHNSWKIRGRMINVGVDQNNFYPVSESQISEMIADIIEGEQI